MTRFSVHPEIQIAKDESFSAKANLIRNIFGLFSIQNCSPASDYVKYNLQMELVFSLLAVVVDVDFFLNVTQATVYNCHKIDRNEHETK